MGNLVPVDPSLPKCNLGSNPSKQQQVNPPKGPHNFLLNPRGRLQASNSIHKLDNSNNNNPRGHPQASHSNNNPNNSNNNPNNSSNVPNLPRDLPGLHKQVHLKTGLSQPFQVAFLSNCNLGNLKHSVPNNWAFLLSWPANNSPVADSSHLADPLHNPNNPEDPLNNNVPSHLVLSLSSTLVS